MLHQLGGQEELSAVWWGYKPRDMSGKAFSSARTDTIINPKSHFWSRLFKAGRVIVPANGWYEWTGPKTNKQPWFLHGADGKPLLIAAITAWQPGAPLNESFGMAVVTHSSDKGLEVIHIRRPVVLEPAAARAWSDPSSSPAEAREIMAGALPSSQFKWYPVRKEVGNWRYETADALTPV